MDDSRVRKASELISTLLSPDVSAKVGQWSGFFGFWAKAAGETLAAHSHPVDVRNGMVFIEAEHPGWIQLLQMEQARILEAIQRAFPELGVTGIAFRLAKDGSLPGTTGRASAREAEDTESSEVDYDTAIRHADSPDGPRSGTVSSVAQIVESVSDDSFRDVLSSLAKTLSETGRKTTKPS